MLLTAGNVTLDELLFELRCHGIRDDFACHFCQGATQLEIVELGLTRYRIRCARCTGTTWGGKRYSMLWNVKGFHSEEEIHSEEVELKLDTIPSHLQDLARQHLVRRDLTRPLLCEVRRNHDAGRLCFECGVDPHYVAISVRADE